MKRAHKTPELSGLVLTRREGQDIHIGSSIVVRVVSIRPDEIRIKIAAPKNVPIVRGEIKP